MGNSRRGLPESIFVWVNTSFATSSCELFTSTAGSFESQAASGVGTSEKGVLESFCRWSDATIAVSSCDMLLSWVEASGTVDVESTGLSSGGSGSLAHRLRSVKSFRADGSLFLSHRSWKGSSSPSGTGANRCAYWSKPALMISESRTPWWSSSFRSRTTTRPCSSLQRCRRSASPRCILGGSFVLLRSMVTSGKDLAFFCSIRLP